MKPGKVERREFEYSRHGTQTLIASFDVVTGEVQGTVGDSRTEADFVAYLEALLTTDAPTSPKVLSASWPGYAVSAKTLARKENPDI